MIQLTALMKKEFKETFRDKRALLMALMMAIMAPVLIFTLSKSMVKDLVEKPPVYVKVSGAEFAPKLIRQLRQQNILLFSQVPGDDKALWHERNIEISIPDSFAQDMREGNTIDVILRTNYSDEAMRTPIRRIRDVITEYAQDIGYKRLLVRGVDIGLLQPVKLIEQDTALPSSNAVFISMMLGLYLLLAAFVSGLSGAIDSSAGERERNVLEMLLCQPVSTLKIVLAKLFCASTIALIGVLLTLVLTSFSVGFVDLAKIGASFNLDALTLLALILLLLPICFFASALQLFVSFGAKSFKEAQSTVTMVIMLPVMIPMALRFIEDKPKWLDWLPVSGQSLFMQDLFKGLPIDWTTLTMTSLVTFAITIALVIILAARLKSEKVVLALS